MVRDCGGRGWGRHHAEGDLHGPGRSVALLSGLSERLHRRQRACRCARCGRIRDGHRPARCPDVRSENTTRSEPHDNAGRFVPRDRDLGNRHPRIGADQYRGDLPGAHRQARLLRQGRVRPQRPGGRRLPRPLRTGGRPGGLENWGALRAVRSASSFEGQSSFAVGVRDKLPFTVTTSVDGNQIAHVIVDIAHS